MDNYKILKRDTDQAPMTDMVSCRSWGGDERHRRSGAYWYHEIFCMYVCVA